MRGQKIIKLMAKIKKRVKQQQQKSPKLKIYTF